MILVVRKREFYPNIRRTCSNLTEKTDGVSLKDDQLKVFKPRVPSLKTNYLRTKLDFFWKPHGPF